MRRRLRQSIRLGMIWWSPALERKLLVCRANWRTWTSGGKPSSRRRRRGSNSWRVLCFRSKKYFHLASTLFILFFKYINCDRVFSCRLVCYVKVINSISVSIHNLAGCFDVRGRYTNMSWIFIQEMFQRLIQTYNLSQFERVFKDKIMEYLRSAKKNQLKKKVEFSCNSSFKIKNNTFLFYN